MQEAQMIVTRIAAGNYTPSVSLLEELRAFLCQARHELELYPERREVRLDLLGRLLLAINIVERNLGGLVHA